MSVCCSCQVAIFQEVLITLVSGTLLFRGRYHFCSIGWNRIVPCRETFLRCRNFYKDAVGHSNATSSALNQIGIFQRAQRTFNAHSAASQSFAQCRKRENHIDEAALIHPVVLLRKSCPVKQQGVEQLRCVAQVDIQQKAGIGQILRQRCSDSQVVGNKIYLQCFFIKQIFGKHFTGCW